MRNLSRVTKEAFSISGTLLVWSEQVKICLGKSWKARFNRMLPTAKRW
jgi:hypothetical protein